MTGGPAIHGCPVHHELVVRALGPDASDGDLVRYAEQVVGCPDCQRLLAVGAGVHPAHLEQVAAGEHEAIAARMAMDDAAVERLVHDLAPRPRWPALVLLAVAAALVFWLAQPIAVPVPVEPVQSAVVPVVQTGPMRGAPRSEALPQALPDAVVALEEEPTRPDWEPPPFEELRTRVPKQVTVRDARLELVGEPSIGTSVRLAVSTVAPEVVTICVAGRENGVVWRGGLPQGRTVLTREGHGVRYQFAGAGRYRFGLVLGEGCSGAVHTVEVSL